MEFLNVLFGDNKTAQAQFEEALKAHPEIKLVNLADGGYVSKSKYDDDIRAKETNINTLTGTIAERDSAISGLRKQLETAGTDAQLLQNLQAQLTTIETQAATDKKNYETALKKEINKGACKDFANGLKFRSKADKEHFISSIIAKNLDMENGKLIGASDYLDWYKTEYADSFVVEEDPEPPVPPIDHRKPNSPPPKITLTERMKMANAKK